MFLTAEHNRTKSIRSKFGVRGMFHPGRIDSLRTLILSPTMPTRMRSKWNEMLSRPATYTLVGPPASWNFPLFYVDPAGNNAISAQVIPDTRACVDYAFRYAVLGDENAAAQAAAILNAYSGIATFVDAGDSALAWHRRWPLLIQAARLLEGSAAYTPTVEAAFKATTVRAQDALEPIAYTRTNNWASVGLVSEMAVSTLVNDRASFDAAVRQWRAHFNEAIRSGITLQGQIRNNIPIHEIYRTGGSNNSTGATGLHYSSMTLAGLAVSAEWARLNGEWLFDHVSPDGSSLRGLFDQVAYWYRFGSPEVLWFNTSNLVDPSDPYYNTGYQIDYLYPWVDILGALWPNENANWLMQNRALTPSQDVYSMRGTELLYRGRPLYG